MTWDYDTQRCNVQDDKEERIVEKETVEPPPWQELLASGAIAIFLLVVGYFALWVIFG